jgi:hypothetical protein
VRRRLAALLGAMVIVAFFACGDPYLHTNPYDPAVPVQVNITGPDSLFSYGEVAQYSVRTIPAFSDSAITWNIDTTTIHRGGNVDTIIGCCLTANPGTGDTVVEGDSLFKLKGFGTYQSIAPPLEPLTQTVTVEALIGRVDTTLARSEACCGNVTIQTNQYRHYGYKSVVLTQRLVRIQLRCPDTHACDTLSVGGTWSVWVDGFDALGRQIYALTSSTANPTRGPPIVTYAAHDPTIAGVAPVRVRAANVTALKSGTTWVVASRGLLADSLRLVVR